MKILVPIDDDARSEQAIATALEMLGGGGELILGFVGELPETTEHQEDASQALNSRLNEVAGRISGVPVRTRLTLAGDPVHGLVDIAREEAVDSVVIATHERSAFRALVDESVADDLREELTGIPVVIVPEDAPRDLEHGPTSRTAYE